LNFDSVARTNTQDGCHSTRQLGISLLPVSSIFPAFIKKLTPPTSTISLPLPSNRLASSALRALEVDAELSPLVRRDFALKSSNPENQADGDEAKTVLETTYRATTNRMLRVAVNGFMESLGVVLGVMEELDVDVLEEESKE
jgi:EKC/KEOPS complex subunit PCC1/LAGE3